MDIEKEVWKLLNPVIAEREREMLSKLDPIPEGELKEYMKMTVQEALKEGSNLDFETIKKNIDKLTQDAS